MAKMNPENGKDPQKDPVSSQGTPATPGSTGEEGASGDLEKTLETTKTQLRELERKLGEEKPMNTVKDPPAAVRNKPSATDPAIPQSGSQDVDQTLAALELDLAQLTQEVAQEIPAPPAAPAEKPLSSPSSQSSIDDLLADLSNELDSVSSPVEEKPAAVPVPPPAAASPAAEKPLPPPVQDIIEHFPGETESPAAPETSVETEKVEVQSIINHIPDVETASDSDTPVAAPPQAEAPQVLPPKPADDPFTAFAKTKDGKLKTPPPAPAKRDEISEDEQVVMNELDQAEKNIHAKAPSAPAVPSASGSSSSPVMLPVQNPYAGFSVPEKVLIYGLQTANKPFTFVGSSTRDKIGVVAVVTLIVTMLAAGLILYFQ